MVKQEEQNPYLMEPFVFLFKSYYPLIFAIFLVKNQQPSQGLVAKHWEEPLPEAVAWGPCVQP